MIRYIFIFLLLLSGCATTQKSSSIEQVAMNKLPNGLSVHEYRLKNGMTILLVPDHSAPVFTFQKWFPIGAAGEKLDPRLNMTGLAHLFEHMMFRGTPSVPDGMFDQKLRLAGGVGMNATTWIDRTNYYQSLPKESLELVFKLESDRMVNLALDEKLFNTERGAVFGELKMNEDNPARYISYILWDLSFVNHPYKYPTIGSRAELKKMTLADAQYFYKTYYAPNNATLILLGDVEIDRALELAQKYYGSVAFQTIPDIKPPVEPAQTNQRRITKEHPQARNKKIRIGFHTPQIDHPDIAVLEVIASMLATGEGAMFKKELVDKGIASTASAWVYTVKYPALFVVDADLKDGVSGKNIERKVFQQINKLKLAKFTEADLERAKNQMLLEQYLTLNSQSGLGSMLGEALMSSGNYMEYFKMFTAAKKVTSADIARVAQKYLQTKSSNVVLLVPPKGE